MDTAPNLGAAANLALDFLLTTALFAMIYNFTPSARIAWRDGRAPWRPRA